MKDRETVRVKKRDSNRENQGRKSTKQTKKKIKK
jgi:hypothetical protein